MLTIKYERTETYKVNDIRSFGFMEKHSDRLLRIFKKTPLSGEIYRRGAVVDF